MSIETHGTGTASPSAALFNIAIIVGGVSGLLWLSTLGDNDIRSKMDFFGTGAGNFVAMILFLIPPVILIRKISGGEMTAKKLTYSIVAMISVQLLLFAYTPAIVKAYQSTGANIADFIIDSKR